MVGTSISARVQPGTRKEIKAGGGVGCGEMHDKVGFLSHHCLDKAQPIGTEFPTYAGPLESWGQRDAENPVMGPPFPAATQSWLEGCVNTWRLRT